MPSSPPNPHREPGRSHPAHWPVVEAQNQSVIVFVTVCTKDRKPILANSDVVTTVMRAWTEADAWSVGRFVILPDHIHLFCAPVRPEFSLKRWVKYWKARTSLVWPSPDQHPVWQDEFWDTQLRQEESYASKWEYARTNPVRHNLVARPEDWPWSGEMHSLLWHDP